MRSSSINDLGATLFFEIGLQRFVDSSRATPPPAHFNSMVFYAIKICVSDKIEVIFFMVHRAVCKFMLSEQLYPLNRRSASDS